MDEAELVEELEELDAELEETGKDLFEHGQTLVLGFARGYTSLYVKQLGVLRITQEEMSLLLANYK